MAEACGKSAFDSLEILKGSDYMENLGFIGPINQGEG
jgi:hypothetical protein